MVISACILRVARLFMNPKQVRSLLAVVKYGSINKAAQYLHLAPSSISAQLKELNHELGVALFEPIGRNIVLSEVGHSLLSSLQAFCAQELHIKQLAHDVSTKLSGVITLFAPSSMCIYRLPNFIQLLQEQAPNLEVLLEHEPYDYATAMAQGDIDIAVVVCDSKNIEQSIAPYWDYQMLYEEEVIFVTHPEHHFDKLMSLEELNTQSLITTEPECSYRIHAEKHFQAHCIALNVRQKFSNVEVIKRCVLGKMGIGLLPKCSVAEELQQKTLLEQAVVGLPYHFQSVVIYPKNVEPSEKLSALLEILKQK